MTLHFDVRKALDTQIQTIHGPRYCYCAMLLVDLGEDAASVLIEVLPMNVEVTYSESRKIWYSSSPTLIGLPPY